MINVYPLFTTRLVAQERP